MLSYLSGCVGQTVVLRLTDRPFHVLMASETSWGDADHVVLLERLAAVDAHGVWVERVRDQGVVEHLIDRAKTIHVLIPWNTIQDVALVVGPPVDGEPLEPLEPLGPKVLSFPKTPVR